TLDVHPPRLLLRPLVLPRDPVVIGIHRHSPAPLRLSATSGARPVWAATPFAPPGHRDHRTALLVRDHPRSRSHPVQRLPGRIGDRVPQGAAFSAFSGLGRAAAFCSPVAPRTPAA